MTQYWVSQYEICISSFIFLFGRRGLFVKKIIILVGRGLMTVNRSIEYFMLVVCDKQVILDVIGIRDQKNNEKCCQNFYKYYIIFKKIDKGCK